MGRQIVGIFFGVVVFLTGCVSTTTDEVRAEKTPFPQTLNAMADVDGALVRAAEADKNLLLIIGANWCHDSKALLTKLEAPSMAPLLLDQYEVQLINVGWFERGFDVAERFGLAIYTHTPTMLIIEPKSERVLNAHDQHIFRDADKMTAEEVLAYFKAKAVPSGWAAVTPQLAKVPAYRVAMADILVFEQEQAERIRTSYAQLGPMLETDSDELMVYWRPVREVRYQLPDDLQILREETRRQAAAGAREIVLRFPQYPAFPWE